MSTLDQLRAEYAANKILKDRFPLATAAPALEGYRTVVLGGAAYLRQCGLLQVTAFWLSKGDDERAVLADIAGWLVKSPMTSAICAGGSGTPARLAVPSTATTALLTALVQRTSLELTVLEAEADSIVGWLKRVTEGRKKEADSVAANAPPGQAPAAPVPTAGAAA